MMGYCIESNESITTGIKRIAGEQTDEALTGLYNHENQHETIHKVRKHLKKLRAVMSLVRHELGEAVYKDQNVFYRDLGRQLEALRDVTSLLETVALLQNRFQDFVKPETFLPVKQFLLEEQTALKSKYLENTNLIETIIRELEQSSGRLEHLPIKSECWDKVLSSVKFVYEHGYQVFHNILKKPTSESVHEWRKQVKHLWYHHRLLRNAWPTIMNSFRHEAKILGDVLGDYHDLTLLKTKMISIQTHLPTDTIQIIDALASKEQEILLEKAYLQGDRLYAEKPKAFERRLKHYLKTWRREREQLIKDGRIEITNF